MNYTKYELRLKKVEVKEDTEEYIFKDVIGAYKFAKNVIELNTYPEEHFYVASLNNKGSVIGYFEISKGDINSSHAGAREVFRPAIVQNAASVILFHNHPSGDCSPSKDDKNVTERLVKAGKILGIQVVDHIIVGEDKYFSFKAERLI